MSCLPVLCRNPQVKNLLFQHRTRGITSRLANPQKQCPAEYRFRDRPLPGRKRMSRICTSKFWVSSCRHKYFFSVRIYYTFRDKNIILILIIFQCRSLLKPNFVANQNLRFIMTLWEICWEIKKLQLIPFLSGRSKSRGISCKTITIQNSNTNAPPGSRS